LISPGEFIPILEKSVFMLKLDYWVIERSFQVLKILDDEGFKQQTISINLSSAQFLDPVLCEFLQKMFKRYQISPSRIDLELTETTLVSDIHSTTKIMRDLRNLGVRISIDDFGTGYSSLSYLKSMPVNTIKIDRSFINGILKNQADKQIVHSTITMVHNMGMTVVAEGIEDVRQFNLLRDMQCDKAQGFYIAKPIPEYELMKILPSMIKDNVWQASYADSVADNDKTVHQQLTPF
jgi:EAL domain-containing protein (putative c-di-GMP-specific phosphodiesterase class I)